MDKKSIGHFGILSRAHIAKQIAGAAAIEAAVDGAFEAALREETKRVVPRLLNGSHEERLLALTEWKTRMMALAGDDAIKTTRIAVAEASTRARIDERRKASARENALVDLLIKSAIPENAGISKHANSAADDQDSDAAAKKARTGVPYKKIIEHFHLGDAWKEKLRKPDRSKPYACAEVSPGTPRKGGSRTFNPAIFGALLIKNKETGYTAIRVGTIIRNHFSDWIDEWDGESKDLTAPF